MQSNDAVSEINANLSSISKWASDNGLVLNPSKSIAMCVGSKSMCAKAHNYLTNDIVLNNVTINPCKSAKYLGLILDCNLNFEDHVISRCRMAYAKLNYLYKFKDSLSCELKWRLVNSLVLSNLEYCSSVYFWFLTNHFQHKLQLVQNACFRFSYNICRKQHITPYYNQLNILKLEGRFTLLYLTLLFKIMDTSLPSYLFKLLNYRTNIHTLNLRNINELTIPRHQSSLFKHSFYYMAPFLYNKFIASSNCSKFNAVKSICKNKLLSDQHL